MLHSEPDPPVPPRNPNSDIEDLTMHVDESPAVDWCDTEDELKVSGDDSDDEPVTGKRTRDDDEDTACKAAKADDGTKITQDNLHSAVAWYKTMENQLAGNIQVELKQDNTWESGIVIVDGLDMKTKPFLRALKSRVPKIMQYMKPSDVRKLSKGGFLLKMKPEDCPSMLGWIETLSKTPSAVRVHPPTGSTNNSERTVFVYGIDANISEDEVKDSLLPPAEAVQRCYRDGKPTTTCKILYYNKELTQMVLDSGKVLFDGYEFLRVAKPNKRKQTPYCRTCKYPTSRCNGGRSCAKLRCGFCGVADSHKTRDCPHDKDSMNCIQCDADDHHVFNCPHVDAINVKTELQRKKEADEKKKMKAEKKQKSQKAHKTDKPKQKSYAEAAGATQQQQPSNPSNANTGSQLKSFGITMDDILEAMVESMVEILYDEIDPTVRTKIAQSTKKKLQHKLRGRTEATEATKADDTDSKNDAEMEICEINDLSENSPESQSVSSNQRTESEILPPLPLPTPLSSPSKPYRAQNVDNPMMDVENTNSDRPALVSAKSNKKTLIESNDVTTKTIKSKSQKVSANTKVKCQFCSKSFAAKGFRTHMRSCKKKHNGSKYTQTTIKTNNQNQQ